MDGLVDGFAADRAALTVLPERPLPDAEPLGAVNGRVVLAPRRFQMVTLRLRWARPPTQRRHRMESD
ncbi:hypothetical protein AB5J72_07505 [Streptomyces sp. CG1]|uniref:hypothetical protein n=1 Tax=Streptomyces sp. CG1 TaxID=1287523 RepID=UPI0034E1BA21